MKVIVVNDCSKGGHFGCQTVMDGYRRLLERHGHKLIATVEGRHACSYGGYDAADLVIVNAEGTIHDNWGWHLLKAAEGHPRVLMNGVWQNNSAFSDFPMHTFNRFTFREILSTNNFKITTGLPCEVVPDVFLWSPHLYDRRSDRPRRGATVTDGATRRGEGWLSVYQEPRKVFDQLAEHAVVVTGRFHVILACAALGIPFLAYPSNTWKNKGLLVGMGLSRVYFQSREEALEALIDANRDELEENARIAKSWVLFAKERTDQEFASLEWYV